MSLEIRQLVLKATVSGDASGGVGQLVSDSQTLDTLKDEILAACQRLLREELPEALRQELRQQQER